MNDNDVGPVHRELFGTMRISLVQNATSMETGRAYLIRQHSDPFGYSRRIR